MNEIIVFMIGVLVTLVILALVVGIVTIFGLIKKNKNLNCDVENLNEYSNDMFRDYNERFEKLESSLISTIEDNKKDIISYVDSRFDKILNKIKE